MADFTNTRVWFITGSSQGIGKAMVAALLASGTERVVATLRNPADLADLTAKYPPEQLLVLQVDVSKTADIDRAFEAAEEHFRRLDVVVNNAGYGVLGELEAVPEEVARAVFEVLYWGPVHVMKKAAKFFREVNPPGHGGRILNISSSGIGSVYPGLSYYSSPKLALETTTEAFSRELPPQWNISAVVINPGAYNTNARHSFLQAPSLPEYPADSPIAKVRAHADHGFLIGDTEKAAHAIITIGGEKGVPLKLQLGTDAWASVVKKAKTILSDAEKWAELAHSTNIDGVVTEEAIAQQFERF
ncbi:NAD(P)-binding protein [Artomyces pyxidatus]|uniref:NAD(P)-binding protein n=1 Tax=Artomyces pyxidatus TaxID=48021 RepID=A0ACB8SSE7_9AGAM|nr:NAD(P)-binding protein [Artomyces pyxidatus]